jgi:hypothetical protein
VRGGVGARDRQSQRPRVPDPDRLRCGSLANTDLRAAFCAIQRALTLGDIGHASTMHRRVGDAMFVRGPTGAGMYISSTTGHYGGHQPSLRHPLPPSDGGC